MAHQERRWALKALLVFASVIPLAFGNSDVHHLDNSSDTLPMAPSALDEYIVVSNNVDPTTDTSMVDSTSRLMEQGDSEIILRDDYRNVILVMGMTGAGKTTMTQLVSGDNTQLTAYEDGGGGFLIKDTQNRISVKNIVSKSIFPELVIDNATNSALYDCPGFGDTRNASIEIANTYFVKKVIEHSHSLKILLVVNHNAVRSGRDRSTFLALMRHMLQLLNNTEDFRHSIAMIVTKVELLRRQTEESVLKGVGDFLEQFREELAEITFSERKSDVAALLDALLQRDETGRLVNVQLFLQPEETGPLSDIPAVQDNRMKLRQLIFDNSHFVYQSVKSSDFGLTLSSDAKIVIHSLLKSLKTRLDLSLTNFSTQLPELYNSKLQRINPDQLQETRDQDFDHILTTIKSLDPIQDFETDEILSVYQNLTNKLQIHSPEKLFDALSRHSSHINFLEDMTETRIEDSLFNGFTGQLYKVLKDFADGLAKNNSQLIIESLQHHLNTLYEKKVSSINTFEELKQTIQDDANNLAEFLSLNPSDLLTILDRYKTLEEILGMPNASQTATDLRRYAEYFVLIQNEVSGEDNETTKLGSKFLTAIRKFKEGVKSYTEYFKLLDTLMNQLESAAMPSQLSDRIKQIHTKEDSLNPEDIRSLTSFPVTRYLDQLLSPGRSTKTDLLPALFSVVSTNHICLYEAENAAIIATGHFLTMSEVIRCVKSKSDSNLRHIVIMATKLFTVDSDFEEVDNSSALNMYIFAPELFVHGDRRISLDGKPGKDFESPALLGKSGDTGFPGTAGGQFLGVFPTMRLDKSLTISVRGGRGGKGQKGGSGHGDKYGSNNGAAVRRSEISRHDNGWDIRSPYGHHKIGCCNRAETSYCTCTAFEVYGQPGKPGNPGGDGGEGGQGGNSGTIHFAFGNNPPGLRKLTGQGEQGSAGPGGDGSPGGRRGLGMKVHRERDYTNPGKGAAYGSSAGAVGFGLGFLLVPLLGPFGPVVGGAIGAGVGASAGAGIGAAITTQGSLEFHDYIHSSETGPPGQRGLAGQRNYPIKLPPLPLNNIEVIQKAYANYEKFLKRFQSNPFLRSTITNFLIQIKPWILSLNSA